MYVGKVPSTRAQVTSMAGSSAKVWSSVAGKRIVLRSVNEHAVSASSTAVCQAKTEETILENPPMYLSVSMGEPLAGGQIRTIRGRLVQMLKIDVDITDPVVPVVVLSWTDSRHASTTNTLSTLSPSAGGLGLASAVRVRPAAHWSSWADSFHMVRQRHAAIAERMVVGLEVDDPVVCFRSVRQ